MANLFLKTSAFFNEFTQIVKYLIAVEQFATRSLCGTALHFAFNR
jgi:hypothetical protein